MVTLERMGQSGGQCRPPEKRCEEGRGEGEDQPGPCQLPWAAILGLLKGWGACVSTRPRSSREGRTQKSVTRSGHGLASGAPGSQPDPRPPELPWLGVTRACPLLEASPSQPG